MKNRANVKLLAPIFAILILLTTLLSVGIVVGASNGTGDYVLETVGTVTGGLNTWKESPKVSYEHTGSKLNLEVTMAPATANDAPNVAGYIVKIGVGKTAEQITLWPTSVIYGSPTVTTAAVTTDLTVAHTMRILVDGTSLKIYIDGTEVMDTTLSTAYDGGKFTFHSRSNNVAAANTIFTNLRISSSLDITATTTTTAASSTTTTTTTGGNDTPSNAQSTAIIATVGTTATTGTWRALALPITHAGTGFEVEFTVAPVDAAQNISRYMLEYGIVGSDKWQVIVTGGYAALVQGSTTLATENMTTDMKAEHTIKVVVADKSVTVFVDGTQAMSKTIDTSYAGGAMKLYSRDGSATFSNLKVTGGVTTYTNASATSTGGGTWRAISLPISQQGGDFVAEYTIVRAGTDTLSAAMMEYGIATGVKYQAIFNGTQAYFAYNESVFKSYAHTADMTATHTVKVVISGKHSRMYLDGKKVVEGDSDTAYTGGAFKIYGRTSNVTVTNLTLKIGETLPADAPIVTTTTVTTTTTTDASATTTTTATPEPDPNAPELEEVVIFLPEAGSSNSNSTYRLVATDPMGCVGNKFELEFDFTPISKTSSEALDAILVEYGVTSTGTKWQAMIWAGNVTLNYGSTTIANVPHTTDLSVGHKFKLVVNGTLAQIYVDGEKILEKVTDVAFSGGNFQFYGRKGNIKMTNLRLVTYREKEVLPDGERYLVEAKELANIKNWRGMSNSTYVEKISPTKIDADNFTLEYKITNTDGDKVNIIFFGLQDLNNRIMGPLSYVRVSPGLVEYWERPDGETSGDVRMGSTTNLPASYDGTEFTVKLVVDRKNVTLFINGVQVMEVTMSNAFAGGGLNLADRKTTATYSDIKVTYYTDKLPDSALTPTKPEVGADMVWVENEALGELDDWNFIGSAESTYREYLSPVNVGQSNFQLDMDIEYLMGDGRQYYIDFGLQSATEENRGKGPYYSFVFNQGTVFLYYRAEDVDELEKTWVVPSGAVSDDPFHVRLYVDGTYAALYLGSTEEPVLEHTLKHAYTGGGFNLKSRNTFAFFNELSIQSYMDKASASTTTTTIKTTTTTGEPAGENPDTGFEFPVVVLLTAMLAFGVAMVAATKRLVVRK